MKNSFERVETKTYIKLLHNDLWPNKTCLEYLSFTQNYMNEGKIKLGGCMVAMDNPNWHCKKCEHEY